MSPAQPQLADFVRTNKQAIIDAWASEVTARFSIKVEQAQLVNDLPQLLDEIVATLRTPPERWSPPESARKHGRQRMKLGIDVGALTEEITLVGEIIVVLGHRAGRALTGPEMRRLMRIIGRCASESVREYANLRDQQLADQAAEQFSFVAHELRTPLNTARLTSARLTATNDVRRLERALSQIAQLVDNFLVEAKLTAQGTPQLRRVAAREIVEAALPDAEASATARRISIATEIDAFDLDLDPKLIVSALTNLLTNAVKFSCDGGRVTVRARTVDDRALFEVDDECGGMSDDLPGRLFQPFVQGDADRSGFGLGLSIVKQAVHAHRGSIRVVNKPPHGCCFVVELPRNQQATRPGAGEPA